jgi:Cu/Ag efflux pump CusA
LGDVAHVSLEQAPALVNRDKQSRRLIVEFNVRGRGVVSTVEEARAAVAAKVALPGATGSSGAVNFTTTPRRVRGWRWWCRWRSA